MTDWKQEHDAELGLRREWSARAQKAEADNARLRVALEPFTKLGGPNDGVMPAFHDLPDDVVLYSNSGECITAGDVRAARDAFGLLHAPWKIPSADGDAST